MATEDIPYMMSVKNIGAILDKVETRLDELEEEGVAVRASSDPRALQRIIPLDEFSPSTR